MNKHACIKCGKEYSDADVDAYYCPECVEVKNKVAKEIDRKLGKNVQRSAKSGLQILEEQGHTFTAPNGRKLTLMKF